MNNVSVPAPMTDLLVPAAAAATITVDPCRDARWQTLLSRFHGDVFHSPAWMQVLADTYGLETRAHLVLDAEGTPIGGLPFCHIRDIFGYRLVTLPFSDYCDPLAMTVDAWEMLTSAHLEHDCPIAIRCLHNDLPLDDARFELVKRARWHGLDLRPDLDRLWRGFHPSTHRAVRKSQRDGVVVRIAQTRQELRTFYEMHLATRKYKYRMLAQPYCFLENIWRHFIEQGSGLLLLARYADRIIAGVMFLRWKDTMYYKFNASASADLEHRPNDQLVWEGIRLAKESGCTSLDFGLSDWDQDGLIGYKRKFASIEKAISFLRHSSSRPTGSDACQTRALLTALTDLFVSRSVPDDVTERASENLYRYFC
jgi:CelD/BcsL family acetyltransferase involved in cellulose biosynthesis